jgi:hypothetical protein
VQPIADTLPTLAPEIVPIAAPLLGRFAHRLASVVRTQVKWFLSTGLLISSLAEAADTSTNEAPALRLVGPQDYQVFQRQNRSGGVVILEGQIGKRGFLEARLGDAAWQRIQVKSDGGSFRAELPAAAGGWYELRVRLQENGQTLTETTVTHVGVGEVFVVAGQSNAANFGAEKQQTQTGKVASFDGSRWRLAHDPQGGAGGNGGSFMPAFGDAVATKLGVPVAVVPCAIGATSVRQWLPPGATMTNQPTTGAMVKLVQPGVWACTGEAFDRLGKRLAYFGAHGIRAVLWHQGESDAGQARAGYPADRQITGEQYREFMQQLIQATRQQAGWPIPWLTALATYHSESDPADAEFRAAQRLLWTTGWAIEGPDTDALRGEYRAGVHFNRCGLSAHGRLWSEKVLAYIEKTN